MNFIDTHTHLYDEAFIDSDGEDAAVRRALDAGVHKLILPDENAACRERMTALASRWPGTAFRCLGLHPTELGENPGEELRSLEEADRSGAVAIGETGMDLYWTRDNVGLQEEVFRRHIELALETGLPLIIHARNALEQIFKVLEDYRGRGLRGTFHAFSGSIETFRRLDRYGDWYVGIGGVVTFRNAGIAQVVRDIPLDRILLETDSPYLTPVPHRGERNESAYIPLIASFIASVREVSVEEIAAVTTAGACTLFGI